MVGLVRIYKDAAAVAEVAASLILNAVRFESELKEHFSLVLSGGSTPDSVYGRLAHPDLAGAPEWQHVHFFWGDERCVPPDHPESNYRRTKEILLNSLDVPAGNIHRIPVELGCRAAAHIYESDLRRFFSDLEPAASRSENPDLVILGLGEDGHTASLFPSDAALAETERWTVDVEHRIPPLPLVDRVSLTLELINRAKRILFLVTGSAKAAIVRRIFSERDASPELPAQRVQPREGELTWLLDEAAAALWQA